MAPFACYSNPTPVYQPAMRVVSAITNANPASVTTAINHNYSTGLIVRIDIPRPIQGTQGVGMEQINQQFGTITVTGPTTFTIPIDTTAYTPFALPAVPPQNYTCAQAVPIGEDSSLINLATQNVLNSILP
jgi:hypothetical protein